MRRFATVVAAGAAFLLVPVAQAAAEQNHGGPTGQFVTVTVSGTGGGEVTSVEGIGRAGFGPGFDEGDPPIECSYASPGPATGTCESEMENAEGRSEYADIFMEAIPSPGSEFVGWTITQGEAFFGCPANGSEEFGQFCYLGSEFGENAKVTAVFNAAGGAEEFLLTVDTAGTGEGTVTSSPAGIECPVECEAEFEEGDEVELTATPEPGSQFTGWSGDCTGTAICEVTMSEAREVTATFEPTSEFALEIEIEGFGEGEVSCEVNGGGAEPCEAEYEEGTEVALVPEAETGSEFSGWGGDCTGTGACELVMDEAHAVSATFEIEQVTLTVQVEGPGSVTAPEDIDCPGVCGGNYGLGEEVELTATPDEGALFVEWTGSGAGSCAGSSTPTCEVEMNADKTVRAVFEVEAEPESFTLSVSKGGTGSGTVMSSPAGIDCGSVCKASFGEGTGVTLKATPASGSTFTGWSGACVGAEACKVTMSEARAVTATFSAESVAPPPPPGEGIAKVASTAKVKAGKAQLKLTCTGDGPCKGSLKLTAKVKQGKKAKTLTIGKGSFSIAKGAKATLKVKLSGPAKQALTKGPLKAKVKGTGVASSSVKLKA